MKKLLIILPILLSAIVALYIVNMVRHSAGEPSTRPSIVSQPLLEGLPQKDASSIDTSHLAAGLTPPTNKWFSGIALQKTPQTVFPTPLKFTPTENSFTFDLPDVAASKSTIMAVAHQPVRVTVGGATSYEVTRYDETSVDLSFKKDDQTLGTVTLVAGVPYIYYFGASDATLTVDAAGKIVGNAFAYELKGVTTKIAAFDGARLQGTQAVTVPSGGLVTMYAADTDTIKTMDKYAANRIESTSVAYEKTGNSFHTTITYKTVNDTPTYYGRLPHQQNAISGEEVATIYGQLVMEAGQTLDFDTAQIPVKSSLDLSMISSTDRQDIAKTVRQEINAPRTYPPDSYFGGKALYRDAQLLQLASQLGEKQAAATVKDRLRAGLLAWLTTDGSSEKSLYYDTKMHGVVGVTPSFGSEAFNDHHFHYGYFIYAASILAQHDAGFRDAYKNQVNLLVADIANYNTGESLPLRRNFDPYFGHSWASGSSPFADGNNQESSSEAINAWIGVELWAEQTKNSALADQAAWMLSNEAAATSAYWLDFDTSQAPYNTGYAHEIVSLNWGGKRDYATFFSAEPRAMLGILLLPMSPTTEYMSRYDERITAQLKEARASGAAGQFDDYLLMYESLRGVTDQLERAKQLPDTSIDDANSRSYLYAWIMSRE
jgi:endoglucanase Acf2